MVKLKNILIVGGGGREHALAWKAAQSPQVAKVWVAPGNAGTALENNINNVAIAADDVAELLKFAQSEAIDLTIVGPEAPLAAGIVDQFQAANLACFGPTQAAAQLESSKAFCKAFLAQHHIPTARFATFQDAAAAIDYLNTQSFPIVIKADGLAAGKGVVIAENLQDAVDAVKGMLCDQRFGGAGAQIVIEEFLTGEELSFIAICDGEHALPLASSQDHKRRDDHDRGPNTGGMGAYSPAPLCTPELAERIQSSIIEPTLKAMANDGTPYVGFLYAGVMVAPNGQPNVLEFNCRLGDPETQPLMMRLQSDLVELCEAALSKQLNTVKTAWDSRTALTVVMASGGYPAQYEKGLVIKGLPTNTQPNGHVFHAGTALKNNDVVTNGGRVLGITALGDTLAAAQQNAYATVETITWPNCFYRRDIGKKGLATANTKKDATTPP